MGASICRAVAEADIPFNIFDLSALKKQLDLWFEKRIKRACNGEALIIRYADDFVCAFQYPNGLIGAAKG